MFATERSGLDNSRVGAPLNDPRDLALVRVQPDFPPYAWGGAPNVVTDDVVLPGGEEPEEGGFYDFGGGWQPQRNAGVVWLTHYQDVRTNASRARVTTRADGSLLVLWEVWTGDAYIDTYAMAVDPLGGNVVPTISLGTKVRLGRRDDLFELSGGVAIPAGDRAAGELVISLLLP